MAGKDKSVVLWSIHDHISSLSSSVGSAKSSKSEGSGSIGATKVPSGSEKPTESPSIGARGIFIGHKDTVEDVQFCPSR